MEAAQSENGGQIKLASYGILQNPGWMAFLDDGIFELMEDFVDGCRRLFGGRLFDQNTNCTGSYKIHTVQIVILEVNLLLTWTPFCVISPICLDSETFEPNVSFEDQQYMWTHSRNVCMMTLTTFSNGALLPLWQQLVFDLVKTSSAMSYYENGLDCVHNGQGSSELRRVATCK
ncbi:hypothetical protein OUZ56_013131 [Daphnia magna]|uniref:Uncharacterized protein n=1 Tax=Daphnia magna TaxID=35525 RepID=A0ABQ9Z4Y7_9CRUS|nr:hypothetical protein OUZ56_013131 [Daphnia magna]